MPAKQESCCFTGHRPNKLPWGYREEDPRCLLLKNRIRALQTARELISREGRPSREELEFALPRIESMIHKMSKARDKYEPGSRNYKRFDPMVQAMKQVRTAIMQALEG